MTRDKSLFLKFSLSLVFVGLSAQAQITDAFRAQNAVVLYEFDETSGPVLDTANPAFGAPLNLSVLYPGSGVRKNGTIEISAKNLIMSDAPATKIHQKCSASNAMTIEVKLKNNEPSLTNSVMDSDGKIQPLRIVSLSAGLKNRNFIFGQVYDEGEFYRSAINVGQANSLNEPISSPRNTVLLGSAGNQPFQNLVLTRNAQGTARLYMSDALGNMYLAQLDELNFRGSFSKWNDQARLSLGNEVQSAVLAEFQSQITPDANCKDPRCVNSPTRVWKGVLDRVAIYCTALTEEQVVGKITTQKKQDVIQIGTAPISAARKRAAEIYTRLTTAKVPIDHPKVVEMEGFINGGEPLKAAAVATAVPNFYNITVRDFAARMSNREESINVPLNDFTATVIGLVHDPANLSAKELLGGNITYVGDPKKAAIPADPAQDILRSNNHYQALDSGKYDLTQVLVRSTQKLFSTSGVRDNPTPAGLLTSRAFMEAHAIAGTNRRLVEFSFRQFLCAPIAQWADSSGPDAYIGKDIDRFPGGDHAKFTSNCRSCHSGMDSLRGAFASFTFSNGFVKNTAFLAPFIGMNPEESDDTSDNVKLSGSLPVVFKMNQNDRVFKSAKAVEDDSWRNFSTGGSNKAYFGWPAKLSGRGVTEFGQMLADSQAFPRCMASRVYRTVCKREAGQYETAFIDKVGKEFAQQNYNLKYLFQRVAVASECIGEGN